MSGSALAAWLLTLLFLTSPADAPTPSVEDALRELRRGHGLLAKLTENDSKGRDEIYYLLRPSFRVLGKSGDPRAVPAIGRYYEHWKFGTLVSRSLAAIGTPEAMTIVERMLLRNHLCRLDRASCRRLTFLRGARKGHFRVPVIARLIEKEPHLGTVKLGLDNIARSFSDSTASTILEALDRSMFGQSRSRLDDYRAIEVFRGFLGKGLDRKNAWKSQTRGSILNMLLERAESVQSPVISRAVALRALGTHKDPRIISTIETLLEDEDTPHILTVSACAAAVDLGDPRAGPWLLPVLERWLLLARDPDAETQLPVEDIASLLMSAPRLNIQAQDIVRRLLRSKIPELAAAALLAVPILPEPEIEKILKKSLQAKDWRTRSRAIECCRKLRDPHAISGLIRRMKKEKGRLRQEILLALHDLTGVYMPYIAADWENWWKHARVDWSPDSARKDETTQTVVAWDGASYFGISVVSRRICLIADISGSMTGQMSYEGERLPKIDVLKKQLLNLLDSLEKKTYANVYFFNNKYSKLFPHLSTMGSGKMRALERFVEKVVADGGTNIYDPLADALKDPHVDTIYLLSDGAPGSGKYIASWDILQAVKRINRLRRIQINTISIGADRRLMRRLAEQNHGSYVFYK